MRRPCCHHVGDRRLGDAALVAFVHGRVPGRVPRPAPGGVVIAAYVGGPRCGRLHEIEPDAAPVDIPAPESGGSYLLTERVTGGPFGGRPVYAYEPPRSAPARGGCRCGCRRTGVGA